MLQPHLSSSCGPHLPPDIIIKKALTWCRKLTPLMLASCSQDTLCIIFFSSDIAPMTILMQTWIAMQLDMNIEHQLVSLHAINDLDSMTQLRALKTKKSMSAMFWVMLRSVDSKRNFESSTSTKSEVTREELVSGQFQSIFLRRFFLISPCRAATRSLTFNPKCNRTHHKTYLKKVMTASIFLPSLRFHQNVGISAECVMD